MKLNPRIKRKLRSPHINQLECGYIDDFGYMLDDDSCIDINLNQVAVWTIIITGTLTVISFICLVVNVIWDLIFGSL